MKRFNNPLKTEWPKLCTRPSIDKGTLDEKVKGIIKLVKKEGDKALFDLSLKFDQVTLNALKVEPTEFDKAATLVSDELKRPFKSPRPTSKNSIRPKLNRQKKLKQVLG